MRYRGVVYIGSRKVWEGPPRDDRAAANADAVKASGMYRNRHEATGKPSPMKTGVRQA